MRTRVVQRTLFRMQLDPAFAAAVARGEPAAIRHLATGELAALRDAGEAGVLADLGGKRRAQVVGNAASEFVLTLVEADRRRIGMDILAEFPRSEEFHAAIAADAALPLAFGAWIRARVAAHPGILCALAALEEAMATARRAPRAAQTPGRGAVALGPRARLLDLPAGVFDHAQALRASVGAGEAPAQPSQALEVRSGAWGGDGGGGSGDAAETVLIVASAASERHGLRSVAVEKLAPALAALARAAETPLDAAALDALVVASRWDAADVAACVEELVADGVLVRGGRKRFFPP